MSIPPPGTKTSTTGTGEQTTNFTVGEGLYQLYAASIKHTTSAVAIPGRISFVYEEGDGTEVEVILVAGYISQYVPLVLMNSVIFHGPGKLRAICYHVSSMSHTFNVEYRRFEGIHEIWGVR